MNCKHWMGLFAALAVAVAPATGWAGQKNPHKITWKQALQTENKRVNHQGASSVLGVSVGAHVQRIDAQARVHKRMKDLYASLTNDKKALARCKATYNTLQKAARANRLFHHYVLDAANPQDFCKLSAKEVAFLKGFFKGQVTPSRARQYQNALLLTLNFQQRQIWLVINPQSKLITLVYTYTDDVQNMEELQGRWEPRAVK